jgi:hypothetical protein
VVVEVVDVVGDAGDEAVDVIHMVDAVECGIDAFDWTVMTGTEIVLKVNEMYAKVVLNWYRFLMNQSKV